MDLIRYFDVMIFLLFTVLWISIVIFLRLKKKKSYVYLLFFTLFYIYLFKVLDYTIIQFQSLLLLKYFMPNLMLNGETAENSLNLIPLITLRLEDVQTSLLNMLLMVPFGFGLPFITNLRLKKVVLIGAIFSVVIELLQLVTGVMANLTFRIVDSNDVFFNTLGVAIGCLLFVGFLKLYHHVFHNWKKPANPVLRYIAERPQIHPLILEGNENTRSLPRKG